MDAPLNYSIVHIPHDEAGIRQYLEDYKAVRLFSLKSAPRAFGSTYAREIAFEESVWYERLKSHTSNTFMAIENAGKVISISTVVGPLAIGLHELPPLGIPQSGHGGWDGTSPLHFRLNAIFTMPEARRKGISKALIEKSIKYITDEAKAKMKGAVFSIVVDMNNLPAAALYQSVGFIETLRLDPSENIYNLPIILMEYHPPSVVLDIGKLKWSNRQILHADIHRDQ